MKKLKVLELFAGTRSIGKAFEEAGHEVYSIDWDTQHKDIDWYVDIGTVTKEDILQRFGKPDIIWASPDCTTYSVAAISRHRVREPNGNLKGVTEYAMKCDTYNEHLVQLIKDLNPKFYFIENPRGAMRKMNFVNGLPRYTVTYCQYGDTRMKPTDIWSNHPNPDFKEPCKNGDKCHTPAPRGSRTGTQALKNKIEKAKIPYELCKHIVEISQLETWKKVYRCEECLSVFNSEFSVCEKCLSSNCKHEMFVESQKRTSDMTFDEFNALAKLIPNYQSDDYTYYLWDNREEYNEMLKRNDSLIVYTVIDAENRLWIHNGIRIANRIGYLFAENFVEINEGVEY